MTARARAGSLLGLAAALAGCQTPDLGGLFPTAGGSVALVATAAETPAPGPALPGAPTDDAALGREHYGAGRHGLAEIHFRRAVEANRDNLEAWLGLAAAYDRLKRFDLADRAYAQALRLTGPTAAFLNNRGYSYLLRGDLRRASRDLTDALALDPQNERIRNNLDALDAQARRRL